MSDFRNALSGRIREKQDELEQIQIQKQALDERERSIQAELEAYQSVLRIENASIHRPPSEPEGMSQPLSNFIVEKLQERPMSKGELRVEAETVGTFGGNGSLGRSLHFTLINLVKSAKVMVGREGRYHVNPLIYPEMPTEPVIRNRLMETLGAAERSQ